MRTKPRFKIKIVDSVSGLSWLYSATDLNMTHEIPTRPFSLLGEHAPFVETQPPRVSLYFTAASSRTTSKTKESTKNKGARNGKKIGSSRKKAR